jgi:hypothetical protein
VETFAPFRHTVFRWLWFASPASNLLAFHFSLAAAEGDMTPVHVPEPQIAATPDPDDGPVMVTAERRIDPAERVAFTLRWRNCVARGAVMARSGTVSGTTSTTRRASSRATSWLHARAFHRGEDGVEVRWHLLLHPERTGAPRSNAGIV